MNINGLWPYSESVNGNRTGDFVKTWRHVHDIFRQEGATNATWVWCATGEYHGSLPLKGLYPGDDYVDWSCIDAYNWDYEFDAVQRRCSGRPTTRCRRSRPSKPLLIGETASTEKGGSKAGVDHRRAHDADPAQLPERQGPRLVREVRGPGLADRDLAGGEGRVRRPASPRRSTPARRSATSPSPIPPLSPVVTKSATDDGVDGRPDRTGDGTPSGPSAAKRCVARRSKVTGKRVLVCTKRVGDPGRSRPSARIRAGTQPARRRPRGERGVPHHAEPGHEASSCASPAARASATSPCPARSSCALRRGEQGVLFAGRLSTKRTLTPGRYRLAVTAVSATGTRSQTVRDTFTLLK